MKKIIALLCFVVTMQTMFAQDPIRQSGNKIVDSLKAELSKTTNPLDRFNLIDKLLESINATSGNIDSALCIELLQISQSLKSDSLYATSYNWIGTYFSLNKGENASALEYYFKALPLAEKTGNKRRISSVYFDIAVTYNNLQNNEGLLKYTRKGGENLPDKSHPLYNYMLVQYQRNMATYFLANNQSDSALHFAQALSETSRKAKSILFEYAAMHLNGAAQVAAGENELAEIYFKKALALTSSVKSNGGRMRFSLQYIPYLLNHGRFAEVKEQASQLLELGKEFNNNNLKLPSAGFMRQVFDSLHNEDSAYYYSRMEADLNAQIFSQNNINKMQALVFNEQIRNIEEKAKQEEAELQRKQNIQYSLLAFGIITFVILFLAFSRRHITNTKVIQFLGVVALLVVFEFLNLLLHPFLERITHHNPILMLLALVCIAALLVPLHHKLEKWATHKLVEKNKAIRLAAAKKTIEELEK